MSEESAIKKSVLAGVLIAIGGLFSIAAKPYGNVVQGLCFSVGLFAVLGTGSKLFTGSMLAAQSIWHRKLSVFDAARMWVTLWWLNLLGACTVATMAWLMGFDVAELARAKAALPVYSLLLRAVFCNVMVCFAVWTFNMSGRQPIDALVACVLPVACFVACGFEHSVADMFYMWLGWMQGAVTPLGGVYVVGVSTIGNFIGGTTFAWMVLEDA